MLKETREFLEDLREVWINHLPVDPRQRQFAYLIGVLDLMALLLVIGRYTVAGLTCFAVATIVAIVAHRIKKKWRAHVLQGPSDHSTTNDIGKL